jgi:ribose/xylose/arabinose/galactoside ABC-type transport system permease subunit
MSHSDSPARLPAARMPNTLAGSWEVGLFVFMGLLYAVGILVNQRFFGSTDAFLAILRDAAKFGILAVGMTFVIVNKDIDLSVGSTWGLAAVAFSMVFSPTQALAEVWGAQWATASMAVTGALTMAAIYVAIPGARRIR